MRLERRRRGRNGWGVAIAALAWLPTVIGALVAGQALTGGVVDTLLRKIFGSALGDTKSEGKMNVAIELPEDIARQLRSSWGDMPRRALEAVALEGYRSGALSCGQVGRLLGLNFWETEAFLKEKQAYLPYADSELAQDRASLDSSLGA